MGAQTLHFAKEGRALSCSGQQPVIYWNILPEKTILYTRGRGPRQIIYATVISGKCLFWFTWARLDHFDLWGGQRLSSRGQSPHAYRTDPSCKPSMLCALLSCSVVSNSLQPMDCSPQGSSVHGDSPGKNTRMGCHALLQGIFPTQGSNHIAGGFFTA